MRSSNYTRTSYLMALFAERYTRGVLRRCLSFRGLSDALEKRGCRPRAGRGVVKNASNGKIEAVPSETLRLLS